MPKFLHAAAAALMLGASMAMPPMGQRHTPTFVSAPDYDGLGRKVKPPAHPHHNAKRRTKAWQDFAARVMSTHRDLPDGTRQIDPRDDKYLHSHARGMRGFVKALDRRSASRAA